MLQIVHCNRLEPLARLLATQAPGGDPFRPETIVVQNPGIARWLAQQIAGQRGIAANLEFPLLASYLWRLLGAWLDGLPDETGFEREPLVWRVLGLLPRLLPEPAFAEPRDYLGATPDPIKEIQLAIRIADLFDQYLVYRPRRLLAWEAGAESHWQARLWRALCAGGEPPHRARLGARLATVAADPPTRPLPDPVSLFGLTAIAPAQLELIEHAARHSEIRLYCLNPSSGYWADLRGEGLQARRRGWARRRGRPDPAPEALGNPLLASLGRAGQALQDQLLELDGQPHVAVHELWVEPDRGRLLGLLQGQILDLEERHDGPLPPLADAGIALHVCHGPLREVQVLHDRLLRLFDGLPGLEPRDIVVMAPDIDAYAPLVEAVFGAAPDARRIPFAVADRRLGSEQPLIDALLGLLALPASRLEASEVLGLLELPAVARRFGLAARDLSLLRQWIGESGIRWGLDGAMRAAAGLPDEEANSWAFGLDRLFLGYALPPDTAAGPVAGVMPYGEIDGGDGPLLGGLQALIDALGYWRDELARARPPASWRSLLMRLVDDLLRPDDDEEEAVLQFLAALDALAAATASAGFDAPLAPGALRVALAARLDERRGTHRFLTGRVTFCNMVPMRSIPFRVVCLLGMNGLDFPRAQRPLGFDLMAAAPERGDRSRRDDDRYLFLEALLSARDHLHISYVGRDPRDNSIRVPSVVVSELTERIDALYAGLEPRASRRLVVEHPLQPFSPRCFDPAEPVLQSHAVEWLAAATAPRREEPPFAATPLPLPDDVAKVVERDRLQRFFHDPAAAFLRERLGVALPWQEPPAEDLEPFAPDARERFWLDQRLFDALRAGLDADAACARLRGLGVLPHGTPGRRLFDARAAVVGDFLARLEGVDGAPRAPLELDLEIGEWRLQGRLVGVTAGGLVGARLGRLRPVDRLEFWIDHLLLNLLRPAGCARCSRLVGRDDTIGFAPVEDAADRLAALLRLRRDGLEAPLPLFPESSFGWIEDGHAFGRRFERAWVGGFGSDGEREREAVKIAWRGRDPLAGRFEEVATAVFAPLVAAMEAGA